MTACLSTYDPVAVARLGGAPGGLSRLLHLPAVERRRDQLRLARVRDGARLIVEDPGHLYDLETQRRVQLEVTAGRTLVTPGIDGILPFLAPAWVAFLAVPFDALGNRARRPPVDPVRPAEPGSGSPGQYSGRSQ